MNYHEMDEIYRNIPLNAIPWNIEEPPQMLEDFIESGRIKPCKTIEFGCGTGNYAVYLAGLGFDITGVDISETAINIAKQNARKKGVNVNFFAADILGGMNEVKDTFDFAYDWEVLHHIFPKDRVKYLENVSRLLRPGAKYLSVCFSEKDRHFGSTAKFRKTPLGTSLYFSSEQELNELFNRYFKVTELKTIEISGKKVSHFAVYALMEKS